MPRFKRDANVVPDVLALYRLHDIEQKIPGGPHHTFVRSLANVEGTSHLHDPNSVLDVAHAADEEDTQPGSHRATTLLSEEFCRVMIHNNAHLSPPRELWTRNNIAQLDSNIGRPLPVFQETTGRQFEFLGWYRIARWQLCLGKGTEVRRFIERRKISQKERTVEYWTKALGENWARVEMERVSDTSLQNPMGK